MSQSDYEIRAMQANMDDRLDLVHESLAKVDEALARGDEVLGEPHRHLPTHPGLGICPTCGSDLAVRRDRRNVRASTPALWCWKCRRVLSAAERRRARADMIERWGC